MEIKLDLETYGNYVVHRFMELSDESSNSIKNNLKEEILVLLKRIDEEINKIKDL